MARTLDNLLLGVTLLPSLAAFAALGFPDLELDPLPFLAAMVPSSIVLPAFVGWQWYRQSTDGTTAGKRLADIRIVDRASGAPPGFLAGVVQRVWILSGIQMVLGTGGNLVGLVDALMVFSDLGRTLHDRLAGTRVVRGATPRAEEIVGPDDGDDDLHSDL